MGPTGFGGRAAPQGGRVIVRLWRHFTHGVRFLLDHGVAGLFALGAVFLAVTGAEALYADLGHFGRGPIRFAWLALVLPALALNYLGQGALLLAHPEKLENPFYLLYSD